MSSSIHLQFVVVHFSLTRLCKQLTEHQRMGVSAAHTLQSSLNCFGTNPNSRAFLSKQCILALLRNLLRLNGVTMSMFSLLVILRGLSAWFSIFDTSHLTDLGSKTGYRRFTSMKMSNNLLIHHAGSKHSDHNSTHT